MEKIKRESAEALAREREKRQESEHDRIVEIANYCDANDKLQGTVVDLIEKTNKSARDLEAAKAEKEALEKSSENPPESRPKERSYRRQRLQRRSS